MAKRKHLRVPTTIMVDLFTLDTGEKLARACIVNLSLGGIAIETEAILDMHAEVNMRIMMPEGKEPMEIQAEVMRKQSVGSVYRYGMKYSHLNFFRRLGLKAYLLKWIEHSNINRKVSL